MDSPSSTLRRVGIVFAGGPAPGANSVISVAASSFRRRGIEVLGILNGYSELTRDRSSSLRAGEHYRVFEDRDLWGLRNARGIVIGTARSGPGAGILSPSDLTDTKKARSLRNVYQGLVELGLDALVSIGGDGTLRTANLLSAYQRTLPSDAKRVAIVHVPKTIDNDYRGIDFTFGFFTAVGVIAEELQNLRADAMATRSYFVVETMGRSAGFLAYAAAIAGEAHMVVGLEDAVDFKSPGTDGRLDLDALADRVVDLILTRERRGKPYGTVVLSEGLAEMLPESYVRDHRDESGHVSLRKLDIGRVIAERASARYTARAGRSKKITGIQLGYESRCSAPHAFDVLLGSQLGLGSYRALVEEKLDGYMVSVTGQLDLRYVPFSDLIDEATLSPRVRLVDRKSDFHRLAMELGTRVEKG
jgi:ATP-dependent phosphofructokinase / diphosphate-dependent phosphofructokinase